MWNAIRSDLKEFASSIATDGTTVLENIDSKLKETDINENNEQGDHNNDDNNNSDSTSKDALLAIDPEVAPIAIASEEGGNDNKDTNLNNKDAVYKAMLADAQVEAFRRMEMEVTYLTPLLSSEVNGVKDSQAEAVAADADAATEGGDEHDKEEAGELQEPSAVIAMLDSEQTKGDDDEVDASNKNEDKHDTKDDENLDQGNEDNDINDDDDDDDVEAVKEYLSSFDIQSKTDEISSLLSAQPFLAQQFEHLVPLQVTYEQFWQRYFYRCDPVRIVQEWEEEDERMRLQRQELIGKGVKSVQNIFGGALKAIKGVAVPGQEGKNASGTSIYEKYQAELEAKQKAMLSTQGNSDEEKKGNNLVGSGLLGGALGMFAGNNGRPPFVLNTTTESDDDVVYEDDEELEEEEEEEEELSWGSDDEEEDNDDEYEEEEEEYEDDVENDDLNESETIVFEDKHTTSDGVIQEIENLKAMLEEAQGSKHEAESKAQTLQSQLNQLKEQIEQERISHSKLLQEEMTKVRNEERARASALEGTSREVDDSIKQLTEQLDEMQSRKYEAEVKVRELEMQVSQSKEEMRLQSDNSSRLLAEEKERLENKHAAEMKSAGEIIDGLKAQLESSKAIQQKEQEMTKNLENKLASCKQDLKKQSLNFAKALEDEIAKVRAEAKVTEITPSAQEGSSLSSAVDISPVNESKTQAKAEDEFEEDGWGDSWSDDEE